VRLEKRNDIDELPAALCYRPSHMSEEPGERDLSSGERGVILHHQSLESVIENIKSFSKFHTKLSDAMLRKWGNFCLRLMIRELEAIPATTASIGCDTGVVSN